jgi:hypothetical protein
MSENADFKNATIPLSALKHLHELVNICQDVCSGKITLEVSAIKMNKLDRELNMQINEDLTRFLHEFKTIKPFINGKD